MKLPIYLDNHATTQVDSRVIESLLPCLSEHYGNPASRSHPYGWKARELVEEARQRVARLADCENDEVIFTSGATESINMVLKGVARHRLWPEIHIATCATEHLAVLDTCRALETQGARVTRLPVKSTGLLDLDHLETVLKEDRPTLLSIMHGNNEIGLVHPIEDIAKLCQTYDVLLHVDAAQTLGKIPFHFKKWMIDFASISGHKLYAPKGIGGLLIRRKSPPLRLKQLIDGGDHERGFRSGTLNVPGIVGLGRACELCFDVMELESVRIKSLRDQLEADLKDRISGLIVNGAVADRLPGNLHISIPGIEGQLVIPALRDHLCISSGSACSSANPKPSHVLAAMGISDELSHASIRFGIGRFNTAAEMEYAAEVLPQVIGKLRNP